MMVRPVLKDLSADAFEIREWQPASIEALFFPLVIEVAWEGSTGSNLFYAVVASPEAIRSHMRGPVFSTRATILLSEYNYDALRKCVEDILARAARPTQEESAVVLCRYFEWEYEDYVFDESEEK